MNAGRILLSSETHASSCDHWALIASQTQRHHAAIEQEIQNHDRSVRAPQVSARQGGLPDLNIAECERAR
jgi:hypothetical protein